MTPEIASAVVRELLDEVACLAAEVEARIRTTGMGRLRARLAGLAARCDAPVVTEAAPAPPPASSPPPRRGPDLVPLYTLTRDPCAGNLGRVAGEPFEVQQKRVIRSLGESFFGEPDSETKLWQDVSYARTELVSEREFVRRTGGAAGMGGSA